MLRQVIYLMSACQSDKNRTMSIGPNSYKIDEFLFFAVFLGNRIMFYSRSCHGSDAHTRVEMAVRISVTASFYLCCYELCKYSEN